MFTGAGPLTIYAIIAALFFGGMGGYELRDLQAKAALSNALKQAAKERLRADTAVAAQVATYEEAKRTADEAATRRQTTIREIYRDVAAPPAVCTPPPALVSLLQHGVDEANAASPPSEFDGSVRSSAPGS